jgi:hypothetical protein
LTDLDTWERKYVSDAFFGFNLMDGTRKNTRTAAVGVFRFVPWEENPPTFRFFQHPTPAVAVAPELLPSGSWFRPTASGWAWTPPPD